MVCLTDCPKFILVSFLQSRTEFSIPVVELHERFVPRTHRPDDE